MSRVLALIALFACLAIVFAAEGDTQKNKNDLDTASGLHFGVGLGFHRGFYGHHYGYGYPFYGGHYGGFYPRFGYGYGHGFYG